MARVDMPYARTGRYLVETGMANSRGLRDV